MKFNKKHCKIIYEAIKYYEIHGIPFNSEEHKFCREILEKLESNEKASD